MLRQIKPQQRRRHVFEINPNEIAVAVVNGKVTLPPGNGGTYMACNRLGHVSAAMTSQPQAKRQIHIFEITKKTFVKPANIHNRIATIQSCCRAGSKNLVTFSSTFCDIFPVVTSPGGTAYVINISGSIEFIWIFCL